MSRQLAILTIISLGLIVPSWAGKTYTREEAVQIALEKSSDVQSAEEDLKSAASQVKAGYGNALPSIDLNATVTRIFGLDDVDPKDTTVAQGLIEAGKQLGLGDPSPWDVMALGAINGVVNGMKSQAYRWQSSVGITATQILYAEGKVGTGIEIAKAYKRISEVNLENKKAQVRYDVENAFDQLIYLDSAIQIMYAGWACHRTRPYPRAALDGPAQFQNQEHRKEPYPRPQRPPQHDGPRMGNRRAVPGRTSRPRRRIHLPRHQHG